MVLHVELAKQQPALLEIQQMATRPLITGCPYLQASYLNPALALGVPITSMSMLVGRGLLEQGMAT